MIIQKKVKIFLKKTWRPPQISKNLKIPQDSEEPKILEVSQNNLRISQEFWKSSKIWKSFWKQPEKKSSKSLEFFQNLKIFPKKNRRPPKNLKTPSKIEGGGTGGPLTIEGTHPIFSWSMGVPATPPESCRLTPSRGTSCSASFPIFIRHGRLARFCCRG